MTTFKYEYHTLIDDIRKCVQDCQGKHVQQVAYSTFHDAITQVCFGCKKIRTTIKGGEYDL